MSYAERHTVALTTDASGDATGYTPVVTGRVASIVYNKTDYADTVDFVVTSDAAAQAIWAEDNITASTERTPRQATHDIVGAASLYAAAGEPVEDYIHIANDRVKIVVSNGGDTKSGSFEVIIS